MKSLFLGVLLYSFLSSPALADVVFIDINNSPDEIAAAKAAAEKSKRKFFLFPSEEDVPMKTRKRLVQLQQEIVRQWTQYEKIKIRCKKSAAICDEKGANIQKKITELNAARTELKAGIGFDPEKLGKFFAEREAAGTGISTIVVSGHDGTGDFSGEFADFKDGITDRQLADLLAKNAPSTKNSLTSLHLWGCYTTSPGSLLLNWKNNFPQVALVSGYDDRAPLGDKPAGWHYLKGVIEREPALLAIRDHEKLRKALRAIPGATNVHAGINVCDAYATNTQSYDIGEMKDRCDKLKTDLQENSKSYECYFKASSEECASPPADKANGAVRQFYRILQQSAACSSLFPNESIFSQYSRHSAILLVFNDEVQKNFARIYGPELSESDNMLERLGAPEDLRFKDLDKLTRRELFQRIDRLLAFTSSYGVNPDIHPREIVATEKDAQLKALEALQMSLTSTLVNLAEQCTPFNWTESGVKEESKCISREELGFSGVKMALQDPNSLRSNKIRRMMMELEKRIEQEKAEGRGSEAVDAGRAELFWAQINLMQAYRYGDGKPDAERLKEPTQRIAWAEAVLAAAKAGSPDPIFSPEARRIAVDQNLAQAQETIAYFTPKIENYKKLMQFTQEGSGALQEYEDRVQFHQKVIAALTLEKEALSQPTLSAEKQARREAARYEVGKKIYDRYVAEYQESTKRFQDGLDSLRSQTPIDEDSVKYYEQRLKKYSEESKKLLAERDQAIRKYAHQYLDQPEAKRPDRFW